jgi:hypothetical protein
LECQWQSCQHCWKSSCLYYTHTRSNNFGTEILKPVQSEQLTNSWLIHVSKHACQKKIPWYSLLNPSAGVLWRQSSHISLSTWQQPWKTLSKQGKCRMQSWFICSKTNCLRNSLITHCDP